MPGEPPRWFRALLLTFSAVVWLGWFSPEISDTDFWWHLKTGQYLVETHSLPVPDPFAYTTAAARPVYAGEARVRYFNLTHEWLAQAIFYGVWRAGGFAGLVLFRAALLAAFCGLVGLVAWRRGAPTGPGFYRALAAFFASAGVAARFAVDRPYLFTFFFLALAVAILEWRTAGWRIWLLPPLLLIWANCHGGYVLGWAVLGAYSAEALVLGWRGKPLPGTRALLLASGAAILLSGANPNGYRIPLVLADYHASFLQSRLLEWAPLPLWPLEWPAALLLAGAATLVWAGRRVRVVDWLLFGAFAAAALAASRNAILMGLIAPIVLASYLPEWTRALPRWTRWGAAAALVVALSWGILEGNFFQLRVNPWKWPVGAADFLRAHRIRSPIFNTYEYGGYLMWRLWPEERVFIDGRALSESVFADYARILYNHDATGGKSAQELLDQYGVQVLVMNGFEYVTGNLYLLAPALADPRETTWKLVYNDAQGMVLMRDPPPGVTPLAQLRVLDHLEAECSLHIDHEPQYPRCARALGQVFARIGDLARARKWIGVYLAGPHSPDPEAEEAYRKLAGMGR
jgi:hypothetical protein